MYDRELAYSLMLGVRESLTKIKKRSAGITSADEFAESETGEEKFDSICMLFIAAGENLKRVDVLTGGGLLSRYPEADWSGAMGFRDVIAHQYFQIDHEEVFAIIQDNLDSLLNAVELVIKELA